MRDPAKLTSDVANATQLPQQLAGHGLVLSAFNSGWDNPNSYADFLAGSRAIEKATGAAGVPRLLLIGGASSLFHDGQQLLDGPRFPAEIKPGPTAARDYLNELKQKVKLDWTFFGPDIEMHPGIAAGRTDRYRLGTENPVFDAAGRSVLSGEDLAVAVLDEVEKYQYGCRRFTAAY